MSRPRAAAENRDQQAANAGLEVVDGAVAVHLVPAAVQRQVRQACVAHLHAP